MDFPGAVSHPKPIRVMRVIPDLQVGGVQRMIFRSAMALREHNVQTEVFCIEERGPLAKEFEAAGIPVHVFRFRSRLDPMGLATLRRTTKERKTRIVHGHMYAANMAASMAFFGRRKIAIINSYHSQTPVRDPHQVDMIRRTRNLPDRWIAVSGTVREALLPMGIPNDRITVVHNGIPEPEAPLPHGELKKGLLRLVFVGRFVKQKRHELALEIIARGLEAGIPLHLTMVGDGPMMERMRRLAEELKLTGHVTFAGFQGDVSRFLRDAHLYMNTSNREGFPNALLEACAAGRGFVVSDIGPNRELLAGTGAGLLLEDSVESWVSALRDLHLNRSRIAEMGTEAFTLAKRYTVQETAAKLAALYESIYPW